jgi:heme/copper-type cytochrome/quinol oxidase subunit 2
MWPLEQIRWTLVWRPEQTSWTRVLLLLLVVVVVVVVVVVLVVVLVEHKCSQRDCPVRHIPAD